MCRSRGRLSPIITATDDDCGGRADRGGAFAGTALFLCRPAPYDPLMQSGGQVTRSGPAV